MPASNLGKRTRLSSRDGNSHATLDDLSRVTDLVARGRIRSEVADVFNVSDAGKGHAAMEEQKPAGRIVLQAG